MEEKDEELNFKEITDWLYSQGATIYSAALKEPSLEDAFINLTGKKISSFRFLELAIRNLNELYRDPVA